MRVEQVGTGAAPVPDLLVPVLLAPAVAYARAALASVRPEHRGRPTPCTDWCLDDLLAHLDDGLDAFLEASAGAVALTGAPGPGTPRRDRVPESPGPPGPMTRVTALEAKARALLTAWSGPAALRGDAAVAVGGLPVGADVLLGTAALELTVHGWDVARTAGLDHPVPPALATGLLAVARRCVDDTDRVGRSARFGPARPVPPGADPGATLLAHLGRMPRWGSI